MNFRVFHKRPILDNPCRVGVAVVASVLGLALCAWFPSIRCSKQGEAMGEDQMIIDKNTALTIAKKDAMQVYRDLSIYKVTAELRGGKWYVDYDLEGNLVVGGGPHYVILGTTGEILERRYEQ
jgi:hypothetical protein